MNGRCVDGFVEITGMKVQFWFYICCSENPYLRPCTQVCFQKCDETESLMTMDDMANYVYIEGFVISIWTTLLKDYMRSLLKTMESKRMCMP